MDLPSLSLGKQLNDLAVTAGRKRQSIHTGFVHHLYQDSDEDVKDTIPIAENLFFVLALLRTKNSEQILEAKNLLERLLFFQNAEGNFPIYIHDYPNCKDRFLGAQLLPCYFYILSEFHTVLGSDLKKRLEDVIRKLLEYNLKHISDKTSYSIVLKIAASAKGFGILLHDASLEQKGDRLLNQLHDLGLHSSWLIPSSIADICIALQMVYTFIQKSPWMDFWQHLINTWHRPTYSYAGPGLKQYQKGDEPQSTLYDLFLGYFSQGFAKRSLIDAPYHLQAVLVRPTEEVLPLVQYPLKIENVLNESRWFIYQQDQFAYSLIEKKALQNPAFENGFHPLNIIWGDRERVHSFVCQNGNFDSFNFYPENHKIEFMIDLAQNSELENREKSRELAFFFDIDPEIDMTIHGEKATTFDLNEEFILKTAKMQLSLTVVLEKGEGQFLGHLMQGNRPSQIQLKGTNRFKAYDWQLFFRTLRRSTPCHLKARLHIYSV